MTGVFADFFSPISQWRTWWLMANQDISMRYRRSVLGPFWISISMATMIFGIGLLYGQIFAQDFDTYLMFLAPSILVWSYIAALVTDGCSVAIEAEPHLRSVRIPLPVLAARMSHRNLLVFLHNSVAVGAMILLIGAQVNIASLPIAALGVLLATLAGYFSALVLGPLCLRFRDINQVVGSVVQIMFFLTPVIWMPDQGRVSSWVIQLNPLFHFMELVRAPIVGRSPSMENWLVAVSTVVFLFFAATISLAISRRKLFLWI